LTFGHTNNPFFTLADTFIPPLPPREKGKTGLLIHSSKFSPPNPLVHQDSQPSPSQKRLVPPREPLTVNLVGAMAIAVGVLLVPNPSLRTANLFYNRKPKEEEQSGEKKIDWSLLVYFAWGSLASFTISHSVPTSKAPPVVTPGYQQPLLSKQLDPQSSTSPKSARREVGTETSARPGLSSLRSIGSDHGHRSIVCLQRQNTSKTVMSGG
jgi:hypothetical protein